MELNKLALRGTIPHENTVCNSLSSVLDYSAEKQVSPISTHGEVNLDLRVNLLL